MPLRAPSEDSSPSAGARPTSRQQGRFYPSTFFRQERYAQAHIPTLGWLRQTRSRTGRCQISNKN